MIRELSDMGTRRSLLKDSINNIEYIGKGTYTDCAIKRGLAELLIGYSWTRASTTRNLQLMNEWKGVILRLCVYPPTGAPTTTRTSTLWW